MTIVDQGGNPLANATVSLKTTLPTGSMTTGSGVTAANGTVTFSVKSKATGTYVSEVTNVTHASYTYDPSANVETSESQLVP